MTENQENLVRLLNLAIKDEVDSNIKKENVNWEDVVNEADEHSIKALIYTSAKNMGLLDNIDSKILNEWKRSTILTGVSQINHIKTIGYLLRRFHEANIPVIVLKGLVVRDLYKNPEFRTMGDSDVLVSKDDLDRVRELLISLGYTENNHDDGHEAHIVFDKAGFRRVEVHWTLINDNFFKGTKRFEDNLWENTIYVDVGGTKALSLGLNDLALHLCIHMAVHIAAGGFGLRQLCDLVLLVEKEGEHIQWNIFMKNAKECEVDKFAIAIFKCCNKLFNMEIPEEIECLSPSIEEDFVDLLIQDIFSSGVYGRKEVSKNFSAQIAYTKGNEKEDSESGEAEVFKRFIKFIFPNTENMSDKYSYAKKNKILTPIAWIHHVYEGILNKEYSFEEKTKILTSTVTEAKKRQRLLKWLELD